MKKYLAPILLCFLFGCGTTNTKTLELGPFNIDVPNEWKSDVPEDQEDSLVGRLKGKNLILNFDFSTMGYASHLDDFDDTSRNITIDSSGEYYIKTIWPKVVGKGTTGIYMQSRKTSLNFQMTGNTLTKTQQEQALNAFKTIKINVKGTSEPKPFR